MTIEATKDIICRRVAGRLRPLESLSCFTDGFEFYVAGGCMTRTQNDVDAFCADSPWPTLPPETLVFSSRNAATHKINGELFQFCVYKKPTLIDLLASFDFAHCQIGCKVTVRSGRMIVSGVEWTEQYAAASAAGTSWFTGSEYPLSSLIRTQKYRKNGVMSSGAAIRAALSALTATVRRGFTSYEDFKDQLDAVDLGLLPDELSQVTQADLHELYQLLTKNKDATTTEAR